MRFHAGFSGQKWPHRTQTLHKTLHKIQYHHTTRPASLQTLVPKVVSNTSHVRFDGLLTNASPAILNATNIPTATACRWEVTLTYEVAPEAYN